MAMSKKHFEMITAHFQSQQLLIRSEYPIDERHAYALKTLHQLALDFCTSFRAENPLFDEARFLRACGF